MVGTKAPPVADRYPGLKPWSRHKAMMMSACPHKGQVEILMLER